MLEPDVYDINLIAERAPAQEVRTFYGVGVALSEGGPGMRHQRYRRFNDPLVYESVIKVCRLLGSVCDFWILGDHFLSLCRSSPNKRPQLVTALSQICFGSLNTSVTDPVSGNTKPQYTAMNLAKMIVDEFTSPEYWRLEISNTVRDNKEVKVGASTFDLHEESDSLPATKIVCARNASLMAATALCFGVISCALGSKSTWLIEKLLYPLMSMLASETTLVSDASRIALQQLAMAINCISVNQMLCENADYLVHAVSESFRYLELNPDVRYISFLQIACP